MVQKIMILVLLKQRSISVEYRICLDHVGGVEQQSNTQYAGTEVTCSKSSYSFMLSVNEQGISKNQQSFIHCF